MAQRLSVRDPHSFSNPDQCLVSDVHLNLKIDFAKQIVSGFADISFERKDPKADALILDTKSLSISNVRNRNTMKKMAYVLADHLDHFGSKLEVKLPKSSTKKFTVRIDYETSKEATGLQWLEPEQTSGKKHPYMFSQFQAIHARSFVPCQDTPFVKHTYTAAITAPSELTVLMSAVRDGEEEGTEPDTKTCKFVQKVPIPSYLIAVAAGAIESRKIGPRSHIWAEKEFIDEAAEEFSDTENFLKVGEDLLGPYVWGIYDLLMLPPSFAYGGMENPCLTFITPTLLAGDKSMVDVVAHEISHSWTGNLVTNSNFEHFWLNEGFTMFCERKILGRIHGEPVRQFNAVGGWKELKYCIDTFGENNVVTKLVPDLTGIDPDDAYNSVPYEGGHTFLFYLEELLGGPEVFDNYLKAYVERFQKLSLDTDEWKAHLYEYFHDKKEILDKVDWDAWLYSTGMPPVKPKFDESLGIICQKLCDSWSSADDLSKFSIEDFKDFTSEQKIEFFALLLQDKPLSTEKMAKLTEVYQLEKVKNFEIRFRWVRLGLLAHWEPIIPHALKIVTEVGRMKYVRPVYRDLYNWEESREKAIATYKEHVKKMMYVTAYNVGRDLKLGGIEFNPRLLA